MSKSIQSIAVVLGAAATLSFGAMALASEKKPHGAPVVNKHKVSAKKHAAADPHAKAAPAHGVKPAAHAKGPALHGAWSYDGQSGPGHWGGLKTEYKSCGEGDQQSPIDLSEHVAALSNDVSLHWRPAGFDMVDNGHTIQANVEPGSYLSLKGKRYELLQFHFHHSSEHTLGGRPYSMEVHFVHKAADGQLAVIGVFMTPGAEHDTLAALWNKLPDANAKRAGAAQPVDLTRMLPANRAHFRYAGSLTTPPCSEIVSWIVYRDPIEISGGQIARFAKQYPANARPVQAHNRRFVLGNF